MSITAATTCDDIASIDDVIDLNQEDNNGGGGNQHYYHISLHSIDDDELRLFHRDLVTPAPSVYCFDADNNNNDMVRQPPPPRPISRTESVMLFKKINNGDEDVSFDLVSSELRDFLDTSSILSSRPVSRATNIASNSKFRHKDIYYHNEPPLLLKKETLMMSPSLNPRLTASSNNNKGQKFTTTNKVIQQQQRVINNKDEYLYKQIPKRLVTNGSPSSSVTPPPQQQNTKKQLQQNFNYNHPPLSQNKRNPPSLETVPTRHKTIGRSYIHRVEPSPPVSSVDTPRITRKSLAFNNTNNGHLRAYRVNNRSDTTTFSSSEELVEEEKETSMPSSFIASYAMLQRHRYSVPNTAVNNELHHAIEYKKSLSSSRIKNYNNKSTSTVDNSMSVTDSAKQVLACIRERRKSTMMLMNEGGLCASSPKLEGRISSTTRSSSAQQDISSDFRLRLQIHREKESSSIRRNNNKYITTNSKRYNHYDEENDYNNRFNASRLPQRAIYNR